MTRDDIIRMAQEALGHDFMGQRTIEFAERFAALVVAAEREACAKACEDLEDRENPYERNVAVLDCASAIRARAGAPE